MLVFRGVLNLKFPRSRWTKNVLQETGWWDVKRGESSLREIQGLFLQWRNSFPNEKHAEKHMLQHQVDPLEDG